MGVGRSELWDNLTCSPECLPSVSWVHCQTKPDLTYDREKRGARHAAFYQSPMTPSAAATAASLQVNLDDLRAELLQLPPAGPNGFEGLVATALAELTA